jgi:hypothetical protein
MLETYINDFYAGAASKKSHSRYSTYGRGWSINTNWGVRGCSLLKLKSFGLEEKAWAKNRGLVFQKNEQSISKKMEGYPE